jgi:hypothetical protein
MTTISAKVIADSIGEHAPRLTTLLLRYPRWIHAEGRTHRVMRIAEDMEVEVRTPSLMEDPDLSRNASSSRAMPVEKLIKDVLDDPAIPLFWGKNQKGMQAGEECSNRVRTWDFGGKEGSSWDREGAWLFARDNAIRMARAFSEAGYAKQIVNRLLEPFSHITVLCSATQWSNFFALRRHEAAEPHIHMLADAMWDAMQASTPQLLDVGEWHLPFVNVTDEEGEPKVLRGNSPALTNAIKLSVARCASTSYRTVDGFEMTFLRAVELHDKLVSQAPLHASPCEHQATPNKPRPFQGKAVWLGDQGGNLGPYWIQYRKTLKNECM